MKKKIKIIAKECENFITSLDNIECGIIRVGTRHLNNGYGCLINNKKDGDSCKCFSWNCPFANTADLLDLKTIEPDDFENNCTIFDLDYQTALKLSDDELIEYDTAEFTDNYMRQHIELEDIYVENGDDKDLEEIIGIVSEAREEDLEKLKELYEVVIIIKPMENQNEN